MTSFTIEHQNRSGPWSDPVVLIEQRPSRSAALASGVLAVLLLVVLVPALQALALAYEGDHASGALTRLGLGVLVLTAATAWLAFRSLTALLASRSIEIADAHITVESRGPLGRTWFREPLGAYRGVAVVPATTLDGACSELHLVHDQPARSVVLAVAPRPTALDVEAIERRLGVARLVGTPATRRAPAPALAMGPG